VLALTSSQRPPDQTLDRSLLARTKYPLCNRIRKLPHLSEPPRRSQDSPLIANLTRRRASRIIFRSSPLGNEDRLAWSEGAGGTVPSPAPFKARGSPGGVSATFALDRSVDALTFDSCRLHQRLCSTLTRSKAVARH
jgi:hypothetical protein